MTYISQIIQLGALGILGWVVIHYVAKIYPKEAEANRVAIREMQTAFTTSLKDERVAFERTMKADREACDRRYEHLYSEVEKNTAAIDRLQGVLVFSQSDGSRPSV